MAASLQVADFLLESLHVEGSLPVLLNKVVSLPEHLPEFPAEFLLLGLLEAPVLLASSEHPLVLKPII